MIRLNKYLAQCGINSRRKCDAIIQAGRVTVNNEKVTALGITIDEENDIVAVDRNVVLPQSSACYIVLNKPSGYVTTVHDERNRKTVIDLIPQKHRIFPVGRLDRDTEGLLLLTNDGEISYRLTHPKFAIKKMYLVRIDKSISISDFKKLEHGIMLDDGITAPCKAKLIHADRLKRTLIISIHEGRNRQIRRMFQAIGFAVVQLKRIRFANISLKDLPVGKWRFLTDAEIKHLKKIATIESEHDFIV